MQHLLPGDGEDHPAPAFDGLQLVGPKTGTRCALEAERGVEVLAHQGMFKLSRLAQKVSQLLAVLHDDGRLSPHRRRVSPATAVPKGEYIKRDTGRWPGETIAHVGRHPQRACRAGHPPRPQGNRTRRPGRGRRIAPVDGSRRVRPASGGVTMVIAANGPGLLVRVAALAGADGSGLRLCHYGPLSRRRGPGAGSNPAQPARTRPPHQPEDSLSSSCRRQQLPWTQMRQLCVGGRCRAATRPSDHNGGSGSVTACAAQPHQSGRVGGRRDKQCASG